MKSSTPLLRGVIAAVVCASAASAIAMNDDAGTMSGAVLHQPDKLDWKAGPASLEKGSQFVVLEGDPSKEGPFVMRLKLPDGFQIRPHTHPKIERVTIVAGTFHLAMGEELDRAHATVLQAGAYGFWPPGMVHTAWAEGETIVQLHGVGPWVINYVNPDDDPRQRR